MHRIKRVLSISFANFRKWISNPRIFVLILLLIMIVRNYLSPIIDISKSLGMSITPWVFPYLTCNCYFLLFFMLGIILLFCDAPFCDNTQPYVLIRSNKNEWLLGQIVYLVFASALYVITVILLSIIFLVPYLTFNMDWGKVLGTLSQTEAYTGIYIPYKIQLNYSPVQAMILSFISSWIVCVFLGMIMLFFNINFRHTIGNLISCALIAMVIFARNSPFIVTYFSPVSWASLDIIDPTNTTKYPSILLVFSVLGILIVLLAILSNATFKRKSITLLPTL